MLPAELLLCFCRIAEQEFHLGRAEISGIDAHDRFAGALVDAGLVDALALPGDAAADMGEGALDELAHGMRLAGRQHVIVGLGLLQHAPHALDVIAGVAPVALGVDVAHVERVLHAEVDGRDGAGNLARDEGLAAPRALVVEKNAVRGVHPVGFAVVHDDPVGIELGHRVRTARIERRRLALRRLAHPAVELRCRGLVEAHGFLDAENAHGLEQPQGADAVGLGGIFRRLEAHLDVALGCEIVDLGRLGLGHHPDQVGRIRHVAVMHEEAGAIDMRIDIKVVDAVGVERGGTPLEAVHFIALGEQQFGEIGAVLAGDARNQSDFARHVRPSDKGRSGTGPLCTWKRHGSGQKTTQQAASSTMRRRRRTGARDALDLCAGLPLRL